MNRYWIYVFLAGVVEIAWVSGLKHSETALEWIGTALAIVISFAGMVLASTRLPVGTVYAIFAGIGTGGTVLAETLIFGEAFKLSKIIFIVLLLIGVAGLKLITNDEPAKQAH